MSQGGQVLLSSKMFHSSFTLKYWHGKLQISSVNEACSKASQAAVPMMVPQPCACAGLGGADGTKEMIC